MNRMSMIAKAAPLAIALAALLPATGNAEEGPQGNKGFKATVIQTVDLGPEIPGMEGRQLRMRLLTIEPGGHIGVHSHKDRPAVVYFLKGTDTVTTGDVVKSLKPGDSGAARHDTTHWHRNDGNEPVVLLAIDILKPKK